MNNALFIDNVLAFAVPYGLALQALDVTRIRTTLLPPEIATARMVRRKKPWAVLTAAGVLVGSSIAMMFNGISYGRVNSAGFKEAEEKATAFKGTVDGAVAAYGTEKTTFEGAKKAIEDLVVGRRSMDWMEVFNAINDCLPFDENPGQKPINLRDVISLSHVTFKKEADVNTAWFTKVTAPGQEIAKQNMDPKEFAAPPSGEGYVCTLYGQHWHHDPNDPQGSDVLYLRRTLLANLQKPLLERSVSSGTSAGWAFPMRRSSRSMMCTNSSQARHPQGSAAVARGPQCRASERPGWRRRSRSAWRRLFGRVQLRGPRCRAATTGGFGASAGAYGEGGGAALPGSIAGAFGASPASAPGVIPITPGAAAPPPGINLDDYDQLHRTTFMIQFIYRPIPKGPDRDKPREEAPAADPAADPAAAPAV